MNFLVEYIPYTILLFIVFVVAANYQIPRSKRIAIIFIVVSVFSGIRFDVGHDYPGYYYAVMSPEGSNAGRFEFIVRHLCFITSGHPLAFMMITSLFTHYFVFKCIGQYSAKLLLPVLTFLCMPFFFMNFMCVIRFAMAVAIMFYAYFKYLKDKNLFHFLLFLIVAFNCHVTSVIALLLLVPFERIGAKIHLIMLIICLFVGQVVMSLMIDYSIGKIVGDYYAQHLIYENNEEGQKMLVLYGMLASINLIALFKAKDSEAYKKKLFAMINVGFCFLFMFSYNLAFAGRISRFFIMPMIIAIQFYKIPLLQLKTTRRILVYSLVFLFYIQLYIAQQSLYVSKSKSYMPYSTLIFTDVPPNYQ